jgi:hypothetical protein
MPPGERVPLQPLLYVAIHLLCIIGGMVAVFLCTPGIAALWMFGLGIANVILIRLPARWFGYKPETN